MPASQPGRDKFRWALQKLESRAVRGLWPALRDKGVLVSGETLIDEIRSEAVFHALRNIVRGKFLEFKFDSAIRGDGGEQIAVNVGLRIAGAADVLQDVSRASDPQTDVYGYLLATVSADGAVKFEFKKLSTDDVPQSVKDRFTPDFVNQCFSGNKNTFVPQGGPQPPNCP